MNVGTLPWLLDSNDSKLQNAVIMKKGAITLPSVVKILY